MNTIVIVSAVTFLVFALLGRYLYKCIINPITVFCGLWGFILLLYSLPLYNLFPASSEALMLIISGTGMFSLGAFFSTTFFFKTKKNSVIPSIESNSVTIRYDILLVLNVISFVFLVGFGFSVIISLISGSNFAYIHKMYNVVDEEGILGASSLNRSFVSWIIWPVMHMSLAALAVFSQCDNRSKIPLKKWCAIIIFSNLGLFTLISGKRSFLVEAIVFFVVVYIMRGKKVKLSRKTKLIIIIVAGILVWAFNYISVGRGSDSIISLFYGYLVGCIPHLSVKLQYMPVSVVGFTSIYGFFHAPITLCNVVLHSELLSNIRDSMSQLVEYTQQRVFIGQGMTYNAFLTPFYYFYLDGGWVGNILLSFLFGLVSMHIYHRFLKKRDMYSIVIYVLLFFSLYMSMVRFQFFQMRFVLSSFYAYLVVHVRQKRFVFRRSKLNFKV